MTTHTATASPPTRAAKRYWAVCAIVGAALTVAINFAHGMEVVPAPRTIPSGLIAIVPPLMVIALFEGWFLAKRCAPPHVLRVVMASVVLLGGAAFSISYAGIKMFVSRETGGMPGFAGWVYPALIDTFVIVSAYVLYVLSKHSTAEVQPAAAPHASAPAKQILGNYMQRWVNSSAPKEPQVAPIVEVREPAVEPSTNAAVESMTTSAEPIAEHIEPAVESSAEVVQPSTKPPAKPSTKVSKPAPKPSVDPALLPFMDAAEHMVKEGVVARKTAVELAQVIAAVERRESPNRIKTDLGISPSTTAKVSAAWAEWNSRDDQENAAEPELVGAVA